MPTASKKPTRRKPPLDYETRGGGEPRDVGLVRDEVAYILPMATFLVLTWVGGTWKNLYPASYIAKTFIVGAMLIVFRKSYTRIRWNPTAVMFGVIVGIVGIVQWIALQLWLQNHVHFVDWFKPSPDVFNPMEVFKNPIALWSFIAVRMAGAVLVVPVMEELFWRDYLWRMILAPNDFKLARVGEWGWAPFLIVSIAFATVHGNWWLTAIVWALLVGLLLVHTKNLGACIIAHAVSNLLLAGYVLYTRDWSFW